MCNSLSFDKCTIVKPLPTSRYNVYITPNSVPFDNTNKLDPYWIYFFYLNLCILLLLLQVKNIADGLKYIG